MPTNILLQLLISDFPPCWIPITCPQDFWNLELQSSKNPNLSLFSFTHKNSFCISGTWSAKDFFVLHFGLSNSEFLKWSDGLNRSRSTVHVDSTYRRRIYPMLNSLATSLDSMILTFLGVLLGEFQPFNLLLKEPPLRSNLWCSSRI
jgi:hypothetical protein